MTLTRRQPLSSWAYAGISAIGLIFATALLLFFVYKAHDLQASQIWGQIFYILLIPWGLSAAAFLFGAMRSYAQITHTEVPSKVEIGGPAALAALVVIGGFWLVPSPPSDFTVTARVRYNDSPVNGGTLTLEVEDYTSRPQVINQGMVEFPKVPAKCRNHAARVVTEIEGFVQEKPEREFVLGTDVPVVHLKKKPSIGQK